MPAAARKGDAGVPHCSSYTISSGSESVFINGQPAARVGDSSTSHLKPGGSSCPTHVATISQGSSSVFINGRAAARIGDALSGCTSIAQGSSDVFIG
jgi:uncharacterized Zn-binding protein involved in type VI secretion